MKKKNFFIPTNELFSCRNTIDGKELFKLDRKLVEYLGIRGYGVHLIAYIKQKNSYKLWVPKRNKNKLDRHRQNLTIVLQEELEQEKVFLVL